MLKDNEAYAELVTATSQELLEASILFYNQHNIEAERWIRLGFALAQCQGWELVAPAWLRDWRDKYNICVRPELTNKDTGE